MQQLHVEFMNAPRGSLSRAANAVKKADSGIFWWTIAIVILFALAAFSWIGSIYVFTHPERPFNYKLLSRIQRLEEIRTFNEKDIPKGRSLNPPDLYQRFYPFTQANLASHNNVLRRNYITNFKDRDEKPCFVRGRFRVVHARPLTDEDVFTRGVVARAVALTDEGKEYRNVIVEYVLPTARAVSDAEFQPGDILDIDSRRSKKRLYGSVINIQRMNEDVLVFTVVPLMYGDHQIDAGKKHVLTAVPPMMLNMDGRFPITDHSFGTASGTSAARLPDVASAASPRY